MSGQVPDVRVRDEAPSRSLFRSEVLKGLSGPGKSIPYKYLYDERGSELFEQITELDEYYLTRTELSIMEHHVTDMAEAIGPRCLMIEYGSGSSLKTRLLLEHLEDPVAYVPIDISTEALEQSALSLARAFPDLEVLPVSADYSEPIRMPVPRREPSHRVVFFPGSTIGNFTPDEAQEFLTRVASVVGSGGGLIIGVDLEKESSVLEAAYDDSKGVTASFTKNLLSRINRELDADFDMGLFRHDATYNRVEGRVEIHLVSRERQTVTISGWPIDFHAKEEIHVEYSYKYTLDRFAALAARAGFDVRRVWTDPRRFFSVQHLVAA